MTQLADLSRSLAAAAAQGATAVIGVEGPRTRASGFVWRDGLVVTADEALESEDGLSVRLPDGSQLEARLAGRDPSTDVALLRVDGPLPAPVALDAATPRTLGEVALALGRAEHGTLAAFGILGTVGPAWRSLRGGRIDARLGLDLRLRGAMEGGLVLDADGRAWGMAVRGPRRSALAIPATTVERVAAHLLAHGRVARGYLGLGLQPVRLEDGATGAVVTSLDEGGPAKAAGVLQGDILLRFGGEPVGGMTFRQRLGPESVGQVMELALLRGGEARSVTLTVAERPAP